MSEKSSMVVLWDGHHFLHAISYQFLTVQAFEASSKACVEDFYAYLGAILIPPSSLTTSPLSISFSMMCFASAAYSSGRPRRGGNGTLWASEKTAGSGRVATK